MSNKSDGGNMMKEPHIFRFEECWLVREECRPFVVNNWTADIGGLIGLEKWQEKVRRLRRCLRGWNMNILGERKRAKQVISYKISEFERKANLRELSVEEWFEKTSLDAVLMNIYRENEVWQQQRSRERCYFEGGLITAYVDEESCKSKLVITSLTTENGTLKDDDAIGKHAYKYYKNLFKRDERSNIRLQSGYWDDDLKLSEEDNLHLTEFFTIEEIKEAVWAMEANIIPGPDGMPITFYKEFWDVVKDDLKEMFNEFHSANPKIDRLNFAFIALIPEVEGATCIEQYHPFYLSNISYKIFSKVLANRLSKVVGKIVDKPQNAFLPGTGRNILDGIAIVHEVLHELNKNNMPGILMQIDFERPCDNVHLDFLEEVLILKGFTNKWIQWMKKMLQQGSASVIVNGKPGTYFQIRKGLRHGDPLSPLLFNLVVDALSAMLNKGKENGLLEGLATNLTNKGVLNVHCADDTMLLLKDDVDMAGRLMFLLRCYVMMSGIKINFQKSKVTYIGEDRSKQEEYERVFTCNSGSLPVKYVGVPIRNSRLKRKDWQPLIDEMHSKLMACQSNNLSFDDRVTILNSSLSGAFINTMSLYKLPDWLITEVDRIWARFLWHGTVQKRTCHQRKASQIRVSKEDGSLGILNIRILNECLLSRWLYRFGEHDETLWKEIIDKKYSIYENSTCNIMKNGCSQFMQAVCGTKSMSHLGCDNSLLDGNCICLTCNSWEDSTSFGCKCHGIMRKVETLLSVPLNRCWSKGKWWIPMRRCFSRAGLIELNEVLLEKVNFSTADMNDGQSWKLNSKLSKKFLYNLLKGGGVKPKELQLLWTSKMPPKNKIFLWMVLNDCVLTKENMKKWGWKGSDTRCAFCNAFETRNHLFFQCPVAQHILKLCCSIGGMNWFPTNMTELIDYVVVTSQKEARIILQVASAIFWAIWLIRNKIMSGNKFSTDPSEIVTLASSSLQSWASLQKQEGKELVLSFIARLMEEAALKPLRDNWLVSSTSPI